MVAVKVMEEVLLNGFGLGPHDQVVRMKVLLEAMRGFQKIIL